MSFASIDDLRSQLGATAKPANEAYAKKQLHKVPDAPVVKRSESILAFVRGKRVLEFGASGPMHDAIVKEAAAVLGVDRQDSDGVVGFDLDDTSRDYLPSFDAEVIVCGEVLEHLGNPQFFLARLQRQYPNIPVLITVPNAYALAGYKSLESGIENVNVDHVAWYSYRTLLTLLERVGYRMTLAGWYNGSPRFAEGLIVLAE